MNKRFSNVVALCLKSSSNACCFDDCVLFKDCFPDEFKKMEKESNESKRVC